MAKNSTEFDNPTFSESCDKNPSGKTFGSTLKTKKYWIIGLILLVLVCIGIIAGLVYYFYDTGLSGDTSKTDVVNTTVTTTTETMTTEANTSVITEASTTAATVCPGNFDLAEGRGTCYQIFTDRIHAKTHAEAANACEQLFPGSHLVIIETTAEKDFLASILAKEPQMLEGWQGWWTSGIFNSEINEFVWATTGDTIPSNSPNWGFLKNPRVDTCVWILQISVYDYTWGNYDCATRTGYVCEVELPSR